MTRNTTPPQVSHAVNSCEKLSRHKRISVQTSPGRTRTPRNAMTSSTPVGESFLPTRFVERCPRERLLGNRPRRRWSGDKGGTQWLRSDSNNAGSGPGSLSPFPACMHVCNVCQANKVGHKKVSQAG